MCLRAPASSDLPRFHESTTGKGGNGDTEVAEGTELSLHTPGSIRLIEKGNQDRLDEAYHHLGKTRLYADLFGCTPMEMVGPADIAKLHPLVDTSTIECGLYTEGDGHIDPTSACRACLHLPHLQKSAIEEGRIFAETRLRAKVGSKRASIVAVSYNTRSTEI